MVIKTFEAFSQDLDAALAYSQPGTPITAAAVGVAKAGLDRMNTDRLAC
jgi:hypothetical protein